MRRPTILILAVPLLIAASAPVLPEAEPVDSVLKRARTEAAMADRQVAALEKAASRARDEASRLRAEQAAAAQAIAAAESRITAADAESRILGARLAAQRARLRQEQQPASSLLAGLAMMARRPPLLALAGGGGTDELVRTRLLLDATLPVIERRTAALSARLRSGERLERSAAAARQRLARSRDELAQKRQAFAALESRVLQSARLSTSQAIRAGDASLALNEEVEQIAGSAAALRSAAQIAGELARLGPPPPGPGTASPRQRPPLDYRLPADAPVIDGLGEVSPSGIRSRGLRLSTARGSEVIVPAAGVVRFAGPFRDYDGVVIIDHGRGWMSLIVNAASRLAAGARVRAGEPLGRALGPVGVELSHNGQHLSPALIAGSSATLSKRAKGG